MAEQGAVPSGGRWHGVVPERADGELLGPDDLRVTLRTSPSSAGAWRTSTRSSEAIRPVLRRPGRICRRRVRRCWRHVVDGTPGALARKRVRLDTTCRRRPTGPVTIHIEVGVRIHHLSIPIPPGDQAVGRAFSRGRRRSLRDRDPTLAGTARSRVVAVGDGETEASAAGVPFRSRGRATLRAAHRRLTALRRRLEAAGYATWDGVPIPGGTVFTRILWQPDRAAVAATESTPLIREVVPSSGHGRRRLPTSWSLVCCPARSWKIRRPGVWAATSPSRRTPWLGRRPRR